MNTWVKVGIMVALLGAGFAAGVTYKAGAVARGQVAVSAKRVQQDQKTIDKRVADEHAAAVRAQELLVAEQGKTAALNTQLLDARTRNASLQEEIHRAHFRSPATPAVAGLCPGSPYVDPAYMQLYERAATGHAALGTGGATGHTGGVLALGIRRHP